MGCSTGNNGDTNYSGCGVGFNDITMTLPLKEFISMVQQELSVACAIPLTIKESEIIRIIKTSLDWFYKNHDDFTEARYLVIPKTIFSTDSFKKSRVIKLPSCIFGIYSLKKVNENISSVQSWDGTADFGVERLMLSDSNTMGVGTDNIMYYTLSLYWVDLISHLVTHTISFNYNHISNNLFIGGETPSRDCVAGVYIKLTVEDAIKDEMFFRYIVAKCKLQLTRVLGTFKFNLPGGVELDYSIMRDEGKEEIEKIEEEIKDSQGMDFFFTSGGL